MSKVQILLQADEILCGITTCPLKQKGMHTLSSVKRVGEIKGQGLAIYIYNIFIESYMKSVHSTQ